MFVSLRKYCGLNQTLWGLILKREYILVFRVEHELIILSQRWGCECPKLFIQKHAVLNSGTVEVLAVRGPASLTLQNLHMRNLSKTKTQKWESKK